MSGVGATQVSVRRLVPVLNFFSSSTSPINCCRFLQVLHFHRETYDFKITQSVFQGRSAPSAFQSCGVWVDLDVVCRAQR